MFYWVKWPYFWLFNDVIEGTEWKISKRFFAKRFFILLLFLGASSCWPYSNKPEKINWFIFIFFFVNFIVIFVKQIWKECKVTKRSEEKKYLLDLMKLNVCVKNKFKNSTWKIKKKIWNSKIIILVWGFFEKCLEKYQKKNISNSRNFFHLINVFF